MGIAGVDEMVEVFIVIGVLYLVSKVSVKSEYSQNDLMFILVNIYYTANFAHA